ncbi:MAG: hypothetical protein AAFN92_04465, partial [Bacteroidota bacterium]
MKKTTYSFTRLSWALPLVFLLAFPGEVLDASGINYFSEALLEHPALVSGRSSFNFADHPYIRTYNGLGEGRVALVATGICVNVFNDYDSDGVDDGAGEPPVTTVTVTAYDQDNNANPLTLQGDGSYAFTAPDGSLYRVEVTGLGTGLKPSVAGATTVFFAGNGTTVDIGVHRPGEYYPEDLFLATPCYVEGSAAPTGPNANGDVMVIVPESSLTPGAGNPSPTEYFVANHDQIGATFGTAYSRSAN